MQKSFADCSKCVLFDCQGKVCETNCTKDITKVKTLYLVDSIEWWDEIKEYAESKRQMYLITSPILCHPEEPLSEEGHDIVLNLCKLNANTIIQKTNPLTIVAIGIYSCHVKGKENTKIEVWEDMESFRSGTLENDSIADDLMNDLNVLSEEMPVNVKDISTIENWGSSAQPYMFRIPDKYYTDQYRLVDVQTISGQGRIIYIFRDKDNKKEYYEFPAKENDFYWYESPSNHNKIIEPLDRLELKIGNYKNRCITGKGYGGDVNLTALHSVDYFLQNKDDAQVLAKNSLHFDIEIYTFKDRIFPDPAASLYPINAISFRLYDESESHMYLLKLKGEIDPMIDEIIASKKYKNLTIFNDEYTLLSAFCARVKQYDPDFICGWNSNHFDFPYLVGRMKKLSVEMKELSPFGNVYADARGRVIITGYVPLDQLELYKNLTYINLPSYSLDNVAKKEKAGEKVKYEGNLMTLYNDNIDLFIQYSFQDTDLLCGIEKSTQHVSLQDELRRVTTNSQSNANSTLGQAEGLFLTSMKKKGLIARNSLHNAVKESLPGAYVFDARGGLYDGILCDFDFTSLYPSIINSWNIGPDTFVGVISEGDMFDLIYQRDKLKDKHINITLDPVHNQNETTISLSDLEGLISDNDAQLNIAGTIFKGRHKYESIFYTVISALFNGRKTYKKKMLEAKEAGNDLQENIFNGKQMAYKILANSLYGALANEHFRFYNNNLAKSITLTGQELLKYCAVHCDDYLVNRGNIPNFKMNIDFMDKVKSLTDVIYGDTDSIFCYLTNYLKDKKIEIKKSPEVQTEIDNIQNFVNDVALDPYLKLHNIPRADSIIFLKNEYLFSKYYTLNGKKHYASKVISQEGKDINFIDIKGLEMKRSEIPKRSQALLIEILDVILEDNIKKSDIKKRVDKITKDAKVEMMGLVEKRDNSVVRVVSYSKPLSQYKKQPQHIKAMLIWNCLMGEDFRYGSKGKLWNIKGIDLDKAPESVKSNYSTKFLNTFKTSDLDCICIPEDVEILPPWFIPDMKKIISYSCDDRVANLTEPLWKEAEQILLW